MKINNWFFYVGLTLLLLAGLFVYMSSSEEDIEIETPTNPTVSTEATVRIIAFGDSLTAGYGLPLHESYPAQLEKVLEERGYSVDVINAGVSGETTRGNRERAPFIRSQNPDIILLGIGGNDALRFLPLSETELHMRTTIETLETGDNPPEVILLRMQAPLNQGDTYKRDFDRLYETLAEEYELTLTPFITEDVFFDSTLKLDDGIHLNKDGYARVVEEYILPSVVTILDQQTKEQ